MKISQFSSVTQLCLTLCNLMDCSMPGFPVLHYLLEFAQTMSIELVKPSSHLILCQPLFLLPSVFPSIRIFSSESALCIRWPKYHSFSISPSSEYSGLISFGMDWLDLLEVQGTLKSLLNTTVWKHQLFGTQYSLWFNSYICTWTFVCKVMFLLFNTLSRFVTAFLPRSKCLLISWLQSLSAVIFGVQENNISHCFP